MRVPWLCCLHCEDHTGLGSSRGDGHNPSELLATHHSQEQTAGLSSPVS